MEPNVDEQKLVTRLRAGEDDAFEELVRAHGPRLLAVARRITGDEEEAYDAFQDGLISVFNAIDRFEGQSRLSTWMHRIMINAALQRLRKRRRHPAVSIDELLPQYSADGHRQNPTGRWHGPSDDRIDDELRASIRQAIDTLPADYRDVILLRDIEELDTQETATVLQITTGAVKTRLHRARQALRTLLEEQLP